MIVPQNRLIFWAGFVMITASMLIAMAPSALPAAGAVAALFVLVALMDVLRTLHRLDGISASFPNVMRLTKDREGKIDIEVDNESEKEKILRVGIGFPENIHSPNEDMLIMLPDNGRRSFFQWPCTPAMRGNYLLENIHIETDSPLGLWAIRKTSPARAEVRVYPNALKEQKQLAALFLNKGTFGLHAQTQVGKGKEFEKLREYVPGDGYEDIHWKATAKRGRPITKIFQIERTQELYIIMDSSRLSGRVVETSSSNPLSSGGESQATTQFERFMSAALVLGLIAEKQGDNFGVLAFDDQVRAFVRAKNGKAHYGTCREALYKLNPRMVNPDFGELCSFIRLRLRRRALLIFLTNLDDPVLAESFTRNLELISRHHLILVNMLATPGTTPLFAEGGVRAKSTPLPVSVDNIYEKLGGQLIWQKLRELEKVLRRRGVSMHMLDNEMMAPQLVSQYINVKRRQIL